MTFEPSEWRASDAVTYELAHDALNTLTSLLLAQAASDQARRSDAGAEAANTRQEFLALDGFDRDTLDAFVVRVRARIDEIRTAAP